MVRKLYRHIPYKSLARNKHASSGIASEIKRFGLRRAYLLCERDRIVNVTPPISGAVTAHDASPALANNLSLADLLFADSPSNAASDFRAIAATLFGAEASAQTQSPVKASSNGRKSATGVSAESPDSRKGKEASDPVRPGTPVDLLVPLQNVPVPLIQVPSKLDVSTERQLKPIATGEPAETVINGLSEGGQIKSDNGHAKLAEVAPTDDRIPPSASGDNVAHLIQPTAAEDALKQLPTDGIPRKKEVEPVKSAADRSQPPAVPQTVKQPAPSVVSPERTKQNTDPNFLGSHEKPAVASDALPPRVPVEQNIDTTANNVLESAVATKGVPQSGPLPAGAVAKSKSATSRAASSASAKLKDREIKDSPLAPTQGGKPGFIPAGQPLGGSNTTGTGKDSPNLSLSGHANAHAKPTPLKLSADAASSPASLMDADGPDETLPTSASSPVSAKLVQGMSQSEFRVGMQSQEFGNIDIRTSVARHMFSAQISVEHGDVAKSLTAQLPGLYHRLADQQVAVGNIVIHGQNLGTSSGLAQDAQRQSWQPQGHGANAGTGNLNVEPILPVMSEGIDSAGRLDIRI